MQVLRSIELNIDKQSKMVCDFCSSKKLQKVYDVPESELKVSVFICNHCGLVQSLSQETKKKKERISSNSSGANWGNIRHGKELRLNEQKEVISSLVPWDKTDNVLDVGSNRGDFVKWLQEKKNDINITGLEPDNTIVEEYSTLPNLTLYVERMENLVLHYHHFDFVYCSHTLEHADSASAMLNQICDCMKTDGYLFLEVPNIEVLTLDDVVEEFFIDKHKFHFNHSLLCDYLIFLGFKLIFVSDVKDVFNITLLATKKPNGQSKNFEVVESQLANHNQKNILEYQEKLKVNRNNLVKVAKRLEWFMSRQKVGFWGGGKIFDALVRFGGLNTEKIDCLVDEYLWKIFPRSHEVDIVSPTKLRMAQPDIVIVLARSSADEITEKVRCFGIKNVIKFSDLLEDTFKK